MYIWEVESAEFPDGLNVQYKRGIGMTPKFGAYVAPQRMVLPLTEMKKAMSHRVGGNRELRLEW